jgi:hypothetical protein
VGGIDETETQKAPTTVASDLAGKKGSPNKKPGLRLTGVSVTSTDGEESEGKGDSPPLRPRAAPQSSSSSALAPTVDVAHERTANRLLARARRSGKASSASLSLSPTRFALRMRSA